ncbi:hypothetical protein [Pandoraea sp. XY-2]|uniref:hypothetical protein n=1 Tax=Pandoraea sp. XY-2 TaxID=2518599 RepID=UPI00101F0F4F|nr:hypothetical protein [Pandoraea sp. XY-2]
MPAIPSVYEVLMSTLRQHYKAFVIEAHAQLVGCGGFAVPSHDRRYLPVAIVRGATARHDGSLSDDAPAEGVVIQITLNERLDADPYRALRCAIDYACQVIDGLRSPEFEDMPRGVAFIPLPQTLH